MVNNVPSRTAIPARVGFTVPSIRSDQEVGAIDIEEIVDARLLQEVQQCLASLFLAQQKLLGIDWDNAEEPDLAATTGSQAAKCGRRPVRLVRCVVRRDL